MMFFHGESRALIWLRPTANVALTDVNDRAAARSDLSA
jgi:hypothetical protein